MMCGMNFIYTVKKILQCLFTFLNLDQSVYMTLLRPLLNFWIIENAKDRIDLFYLFL